MFLSLDLVTHTKSSQTKAETLSQSCSASYVTHWRYTRQGPHPIEHQRMAKWSGILGP